MFRVDGLEAFVAGLEKWIDEVELLAVEVYRGLAVQAFWMVVTETPQWTGNAAANWNFSVGGPDTSTTYELLEEDEAKLPLEREVFSKLEPNTEAFEIAQSRNAGRDAAVKDLLTPIFISNNAQSLSGEAYAQLLEANPNNFLRPQNDPGHMVQNAVALLETAYSDLTPSQITRLRGLRIDRALI